MTYAELQYCVHTLVMSDVESTSHGDKYRERVNIELDDQKTKKCVMFNMSQT